MVRRTFGTLYLLLALYGLWVYTADPATFSSLVRVVKVAYWLLMSA